MLFYHSTVKSHQMSLESFLLPSCAVTTEMADDMDRMDCGDCVLETDIVTNEERAENKKEEGNLQYKKKNYKEALQLYTDAIELCPESAAYYGNRSACLMMLGRYASALEDARQAVRLDDTFVKGYLREAKCHIALGDATAALRSLERVRSMDPSNSMLKQEAANAELLKHFDEDSQKALEKKDYRKVVFCVDRALQSAVFCPRLKVLKAECLVHLGRYAEAQELANDILQLDATNADAMYVRGMCLYYQDNIEKALAHFQQVLRLAPDHVKARDIYKRAKLLMSKKAEGNEAFKNGRVQEAYNLYTEALAIDSNNIFTNAKLYFNRATAATKINKLNQAIEDCTNAIKLDENYVKAYLRRGKCYIDSELYEEAVRDYEKAYKLDKSRENKLLLQDAKMELKKSKRKDYYKILGIERNASDDEIKKAYRKRALVHHPDRHANASEDIRREQEKKFKEVGEAYGILSDPKKRSRYDNGQDIEDMEGFSGKGFNDIDPNNIFQAFFGGGQGGQFTFASGPNMGGNFPGGFTFQFG